MSDIAAIVLAAGRGSRFGDEPKLLAELAGRPLVAHAVGAALGSGARPVLVVIGHRAGEVRAALRGLPVTFADNPNHGEGLSTSLRVGFDALPTGVAGAIVLLGDMPNVRSSTIDQLVAAWRGAGRPSAAAPTFAGRRGNPALLSRALAPAIGRLTGDAGAGALIGGLPDLLLVAVDEVGVMQDVDTPEALDGLRRSQASTTPFRIAT